MREETSHEGHLGRRGDRLRARREGRTRALRPDRAPLAPLHREPDGAQDGGTGKDKAFEAAVQAKDLAADAAGKAAEKAPWRHQEETNGKAYTPPVTPRT